MKKFFTKENILGVVQSIVATFLLAIFTPIIDIGKSVASKGWIALSDYFFYSCAHITDGQFLSYFAFCAFLWIMLWAIRHPISAFSSLNDKKTLSNSSNPNVKEPQKSSEDIPEIVKLAIELKESQKKLKVLEIETKIFAIIAIIVDILFLCNIVIFQFIPTIYKDEFDRRITQITPYVEEEEIDLLKSDWVSMTTKSDYDLIDDAIKRIVTENGLS